MNIKLPFKYELTITHWYVGLYYIPHYSDDGIMITRIWWIQYWKKPKGIL